MTSFLYYKPPKTFGNRKSKLRIGVKYIELTNLTIEDLVENSTPKPLNNGYGSNKINKLIFKGKNMKSYL